MIPIWIEKIKYSLDQGAQIECLNFELKNNTLRQMQFYFILLMLNITFFLGYLTVCI